jgi:hypothetical protein
MQRNTVGVVQSVGGYASVVLLLCACKAPRDGDFKIVSGAEPAGTCAIEGYLRGGSVGDAATPIVVALEWKDDEASTEGGGLYPTTSTERRFRVGSIPCDKPRSFAIAVTTTSAHESGSIHTTLAGNHDNLSGRSGDRLTNVRIDVVKGASFHGTVKDATGAPVEGVHVSAKYGSSAYGWSAPPQEFTRTDASGNWTLDGVTMAHFEDQTHASLGFYKAGYLFASQPTSTSAMNVVVEKL